MFETRFSALQRAEIAEIALLTDLLVRATVSVLFNEPKLLKCCCDAQRTPRARRFSALQRAEIAEIWRVEVVYWHKGLFQCSSTSRNC